MDGLITYYCVTLPALKRAAWGRPAGERWRRDYEANLAADKEIAELWNRAAARQEAKMVEYLSTQLWPAKPPRVFGPLGEEAR